MIDRGFDGVAVLVGVIDRSFDGHSFLQGAAAEFHTHEGPSLPSAGAFRLLSPCRGVHHDPRLSRGTSSTLHQVSIARSCSHFVTLEISRYIIDVVPHESLSLSLCVFYGRFHPSDGTQEEHTALRAELVGSRHFKDV